MNRFFNRRTHRKKAKYKYHTIENIIYFDVYKKKRYVYKIETLVLLVHEIKEKTQKEG